MLLHSSSLQYMQQAACASRCAPLVASAAKNVGNGASLDNLLNSATKKLKAFTPVKQTASNPASTQEKAVPAPEQRSRAVLAKQRQGQQPSTAQQKSSQQQQAKGGTPASISTPQQAAEELSPEDLNAWEIETALADIDAAVSSMPDGDIEEASSDDEDDGPSAFHRPAPRGFGSMSMQAAPLHAASRQASEGASTSGRGTSTYTGETTPASKDGIMRVFLYSSEETKAVEAIVELGLEGRLVLVR